MTSEFPNEQDIQYERDCANRVLATHNKARAFDKLKKAITEIKKEHEGNEERINKFIARETEYIINSMEDK